ncbi:transporter [uncultured Erythrobacter sp.]|uniref:transporter n=1 Tax=uncultured Erythrobacter sp. TaxID=263913 RepID=UPI002623C646|nr:transporter [uncultured Erythrobacter sp.]
MKTTNLRLTAAASLTFVLSATSALAHHVAVDSQTGESGPITVISADTPKQGSVSFGTELYVEDYDAFLDEELEHFAEEGFEGVHNTDAAYVAKFSASYAVRDNLTVSAALPYFIRDGIREAEPDHAMHGHGSLGHGSQGHGAATEIHTLGTAAGIGDLQIGAKFGLLDRREAPIGLALIAGLSIPTGDVRERQNDGSRFETEFQPSTGSWDPKAGLAISRSIGPISLDASGVYTFRTEGSQDTNLGDHFAFGAAASWRIGKGPHVHSDGTFERHDAFDLILEFNGEWEERERINGASNLNSGGTQLFISPGARFVSSNGWNAYATVSIPVHEDLNGIQNETDMRFKLGFLVSL